jgi:hypothetical protein
LQPVGGGGRDECGNSDKGENDASHDAILLSGFGRRRKLGVRRATCER